MTKILFIFIFLIFFHVGEVQASEILGKISTDPKALPVKPISPSPEPVADTPTIPNSVTAPVMLFEDEPVATDMLETKKISKAPEKKILGLKIYAEGALLRDSVGRIYVTEGRVKKHLLNLQELAQHRSRPIFSATEEELANYETRGFLNGKLIRERGDAKVYVIVNAKKKHILNLEELRKNYFGLEIFNISSAEMALY